MQTHMGSDAVNALMKMEDWSTEGYEIANALEDTLQLRKLADSTVKRLVWQARRDGYSWQWVADMLGMTRQAAWEKYRSAALPDDYTPPRSDDPELPLG